MRSGKSGSLGGAGLARTRTRRTSGCMKSSLVRVSRFFLFFFTLTLADDREAEADQDPAKTARAERKARIAKNTKQNTANVAAASASVTAARATAAAERAARKEELNRNMLISKTSTASLGKFDNKIQGEPKARGMKRKFDANIPFSSGTGGEGTEKERQMAVLKRVERGETKKSKKGGEGAEGGLNVRKALRFSGEGGKMRPKTTGKKGKRK